MKIPGIDFQKRENQFWRPSVHIYAPFAQRYLCAEGYEITDISERHSYTQ